MVSRTPITPGLFRIRPTLTNAAGIAVIYKYIHQTTIMKIVKKTTLALLLMLTALAVQAQVGVKAGVNFSNMLFEEDEASIEDLARDGATNFTAGLTFILPLGDAVAIQPELLYAQKGGSSTYSFAGVETTNELKYNYLAALT